MSETNVDAQHLAALLRKLADAVERDTPRVYEADLKPKEPFDMEDLGGTGDERFEPRPGWEYAEIKITWWP
jgi:hypothetical protein